MLRAAALALVMVLAGSLPVKASERNVPAPPPPPGDAAATADAPALPSWAIDRPARRPAGLLAMYATYGTLQALDVVSTRKALAAGGHETNPLMGAGGVGRMVAVKAATGAMSIYFAERMWKKNRVGAMLVMGAINGTTAAVVAHNSRIAARR